MTEMEKFNEFIEERIKSASSSESTIGAYLICKNYVNKHFETKLNINTNKTSSELLWEEYRDKLLLSNNVIGYTNCPEMSKIIIITNDKGVIDYFPKADKALEREINTWHKSGLNWLIKILIPHDKTT